MKSETGTHGEKVSAGRRESAVVRAYLTALRGEPERRRDPVQVRARIERIGELLEDADVLTELRLVQERKNLEAELAQKDGVPDRAVLEAAFIEIAGGFSSRKGISYETWREFGVETRVLRAAGVRRVKL